ncbi:unnamed protein product [Caenorhabditis nigoni]
MVTTLSSICVLEYLSFERRQYIASQIPGFRKVEKSLPLHLDSLAISVDKIRIDQNEYYSKNRRSNNFYLCIIELRKRLIQNPIIDGTVFLSAIFEKDRVELEKLMLDLIGNRSMIYTKELAFLDPWLYRFPEKLKIQAEIIEDRLFPLSLEDLDRIANILGPKPLKEFSTQLNNYQIFTHPIVRNSQKLVLWSGSEDFDHRRINHRNIHLKDYDRRILINHMNAWIANVNEVEKEFSGDIEVSGDNNLKLLEEEISIKEMMYLEKCKSGGKRVKANERFHNTVYSICMPRTNVPNTEIQFSLIRISSNNPKFHIHLKTEPSGTAIPEQSDSMYWELKLWEIRKFCQSGESQSLFGNIFVWFLYFLCYGFFIFIFYAMFSVRESLNP